MKRYVLAALLAPAAVFAVMVATGTRGDTAGLAVFNDKGQLLKFQHGAAVEYAAAGAMLAWLTR